MKTKRNPRLFGGIIVASLLAAANIHAQPFGQWDFNSSNLTATVGAALAYTDGGGGATALATKFGTTTSFAISDIAGSPAIIMNFPGATNGMGYNMPTPAANGGGSTVNQYTYILDVFYPTASSGKTRPLIQTSDGVALGSQEFIVIDGASGGIGPLKIGPSGLNGPYVGNILPNTWYRIGIVVTAAGTTRVYTNGVEAGSFSGGALDGFFALNPSATALILADTSTNAAAGYVNSIQLRDVVLSAGQMAAIGAASAAGIPSVIPPVPSYIESRNPGVGATGVAITPAINVVLNQGDTTVNGGSIVLKLDGVAVGTMTPTPPTYTVAYTVPSRLDALSAHSLNLTWTDSVAGSKSATWSFTVRDYQDLILPTPFYFEDFESLTENPSGVTFLPAGWTIANQSGSCHALFDLTDLQSDSYKNWCLITTSRMNDFAAANGVDRTNTPPIFLNGVQVPYLTSGNFMYAESDQRDCQNGEFQELFTRDISCVGRSNVFVAWYSDYEQNQDNLDCVEYSVDGGANWLPVIYYLQGTDDGQGVSDIIRFTSGPLTGQIDVTNTFARIEQNRNWSPDISPTHATNYGIYIKAPITQALAPYIQGRTNDDTLDGKRIEVVRLAQADGKATVRFRFLNTGTGSWFWGVDNLGLYEITTPVFTTQPASATIAAGTGTNLTVVVASPTPVTYQWQHAGTNISNGGHYSGVTTATLTISNADANDAGAYRCKASNSSGPATSNPGTLTVVTVPTITLQPIPVIVSDGYPAGFTGTAFGGLPLTYQWRLNGAAVGSGTSYNIASAHAADAGNYTLVVTNSFGAVTSVVAHLTVVTVPVTNSLVVHLPFDTDYADTSGHGNNATAVNSPVLVAGKLGNAMQFTTSKERAHPSVTNYATLGYPADLKFLDNTDFSISFWINYTNQSDDLALVSNTQWDSSSNPGWGIFSQGGGNFRIKVTSASGGGTRTDVTYGNVIKDGTWHHMVVSFEQGKGIYTVLDGTLLPTKVWTVGGVGTVDTDGADWTRTIDSVVTTGPHSVNIAQDGTGWYNDKGGGAITNALIDDVGFWRRALSPQEALAIFTAGNAGHDLSQAGQPASVGVLNVSSSGANVVFNWAGGAGIRLQRTLSLSPTSWADVAGTLGNSTYSEPKSSFARAFYRLYKP
jgi:hypothetical protein